MISHLSTAIWNKSFHEKNQKVHFGRNPLFPTFRRKLLLQMAVERWEIIFKTCFRYEKHSSESEQYASKKIRVIRRVEMKILQEMDENVVFPTAVSCNQYKKNLQIMQTKSFFIFSKFVVFYENSDRVVKHFDDPNNTSNAD